MCGGPKKGREIWVTEIGLNAFSLDSEALKLPEKLAIVMGRESDGVSQEMVEAADKLVYLPMFGMSFLGISL